MSSKCRPGSSVRLYSYPKQYEKQLEVKDQGQTALKCNRNRISGPVLQIASISIGIQGMFSS